MFCFRKSLYGPTLYSHIWYSTFKDIVISFGFVASRDEGGHFMLNADDQGVVVVTVILYVEDHIIIAKEGSIGYIKDQIKMRFCMHSLGSVICFLARNIEPN
jgi:hypothetical protein